MGIDAPNIDNISLKPNTPLAAEVFEVSNCDNPDFQSQFDELVSESREKTCTLLEDILSERHKEILINIYSQLGENNPELKQAIESQTIRVFDVPERELVALSIDGKNVDYLYDFEGNEYFDFKWRRDDVMRYELFLITLNRIGFNEVLENNKYILNKNGQIIETFSRESLNIYYEVSYIINKLVRSLDYFINENQK